MIRKASLKDVPRISKIFKASTIHMIENNIFQWNKKYPSREIIINSINLQSLSVIEYTSVIIGYMMFSETQDDFYVRVNWLKKLYVHRLAFHPIFQKRLC
jgi:hypothetical protein